MNKTASCDYPWPALGWSVWILTLLALLDNAVLPGLRRHPICCPLAGAALFGTGVGR